MFISDLSSYKAGRLNPMQAIPISPRIDENNVLEKYGTWENIIARCNSLYRNNWFARAVLFYHLDHIIGSTGLKSVGGTLIANEIFKDWSESFVDDTKTKTFLQLQAEIVKGMVDGDVLVYLADDQSPKEGVSPIVLQLIRAIDVRTPSEFKAEGKTYSGNRIVAGIEYAISGEETAFWVKKSGLKDQTDRAETFTRLPKYAKSGRLLAFMARNPDPGMLNQSRSLAVITAILQNIEDVAQLEDSAVEGGITKNMLNMIFQAERPRDFVNGITQKDDESNPIVISQRDGKSAWMGNLSGRSINAMPDGKLTTVSNTGNIDMVALLVRAIKSACAGIGVTFERLTGDFTGVNYSGGKLSDDKNYRRIGRWTSALGLYCEMIRSVVVSAQMSRTGLIPSPDDFKVKGWQSPPKPDPEPVRTATARKTNDSMGLILKSNEVQSMHGMNYTTFLELRKAEKDEEIAILGREIGVEELEIDPKEIEEQAQK